jgi:hypothetical protein
MSYATVMVILTVDQSNEAVLEVAGQLAEKFDAKVIGIAAAALRPGPYFMAGPFFMAGDFAKDFVNQGEASIRKRLSEIEEQFRADMKGRAKNVGWRCSLELPARYIAREARAADIVVVAAGDRDAIVDPFAAAGPNDLVMQAGRPLLVVPPSVRWLDLRSALVAWKDGAEARRAIADALPLLRKTGEVVVAARCCGRPMTWFHGSLATASMRRPWCRKGSAMPRSSSIASPPILRQALSSLVLTAIRGSANGCWAA